MMDIHKRNWYQECSGTLAGLVAASVMMGTTPSDAGTLIDQQLERAYKRGVADAKAGRA